MLLFKTIRDDKELFWRSIVESTFTNTSRLMLFLSTFLMLSLESDFAEDKRIEIITSGSGGPDV